MRKKIEFEVQIDENHLPKKISMETSDSFEKEKALKALFVSAWQSKKKETKN